MGWWEERVLPRLTELTLSAPPVAALRDRVCAGLSGRVLEIGFGSGLNIGHYPSEVTSVDAVEPSDVSWELSRRRREASTVPIRRVGLDGQRLDAPSGAYDAVLSTFTLCTIPDVEAALAEARRVLRPGGRLHVVEHGLAPDARVVAWQRRLDPVQQFFAGGCHLSRDMPELISAAGFRLERLEQEYLPGPVVMRPWTYGTLATAVAP